MRICWHLVRLFAHQYHGDCVRYRAKFGCHQTVAGRHDCEQNVDSRRNEESRTQTKRRMNR
jgi:hypothetical protein